MTAPGFKLRQLNGNGRWIKLVDGAVVGPATDAEVDAWLAFLTADDDEPAIDPNPVDGRPDPPAASIGESYALAETEEQPTDFFWVAPWREPRYDAAKFDEGEFLKRAITAFTAKTGFTPDTVYVRADHPTLQNGLIDKARAIGLRAAGQRYVPTGTYYLARTSPQTEAGGE